MKFEFKNSFDRSIKTLPEEKKQEIKDLCIKLIEVISGEGQLSAGMGLKNIRKNFWEIRKGLKFRILFRWESDYIEFVLAGNHDDIKRYLKR